MLRLRLSQINNALAWRRSVENYSILIQQLGSQHRMFRDLAVNPVAVALIKHMIGSKVTDSQAIIRL